MKNNAAAPDFTPRDDGTLIRHVMYNKIEGQIQAQTTSRPDSNAGVVFRNQLPNVRKVVGESAVLIPVEPRKKKPCRTKWTELTLEATRNPDYIRDLERNNVLATSS